MDSTRLGRLLFGNPTRLRLALWALENSKGRFYQSEPPRSVGAQTAIRQGLDRLAELGMLDLERSDGENRIYYVVTDSPLWRIIEAVEPVVSDRGEI